MGGAELTALLVSVIMAATPLLLAATGQVVCERSGVLNLGVEGMMLVGAVAAFAGAYASGSHSVGLLTGALGGMAMALVFAVLAISLMANQVACGLALTLFGVGVSALIGKPFVGTPLERLPLLDVPGLSDLPVVGPLLFGHDALVYLSVALVIGCHWFLYHSRGGLILRAVGESPDAAHAIGYKVIRVRYLATLFGGAMCGLAGAYMSLAYTPMWAENMTSGRGWIALALVVFATWKPLRAWGGAMLFGAFTIAQLYSQAQGVAVPTQVLAMIPYAATILVLVLISRDEMRIKLNAPASIGKPFHPDR